MSSTDDEKNEIEVTRRFQLHNWETESQKRNTEKKII